MLLFGIGLMVGYFGRQVRGRKVSHSFDSARVTFCATEQLAYSIFQYSEVFGCGCCWAWFYLSVSLSLSVAEREVWLTILQVLLLRLLPRLRRHRNPRRQREISATPTR